MRSIILGMFMGLIAFPTVAAPICMTVDKLNEIAKETKMRPFFSGKGPNWAGKGVEHIVLYIGPSGVWSEVTFSPDGEKACALRDGTGGKLLTTGS